jgi:hypothetical protein
MARRRSLGPLALSAVAVVALISPFTPGAVSSADVEDGPAMSGRSLFLQVRGTVDRKAGGRPERFVYEPDVYDMNNRKIGTVTHDVMFTSVNTLDLVSTFHLPDGDIANHGVEAIGPDGSKQGFYLIGVHADRDSLQPDKSTGAYKGRGGRLRMSGWHDANKFPQTVTFNDFYEITFNS